MHPVAIRHAARDCRARATCPRRGPRDPRRAGRTGRRHPGLPARHGRNPPHRGSARRRRGALVLPLHGDLPPAEQDRALRPAERRRVVLATSIAETSLTVPGVRIVVDGGFRRAPRLDASTGLTRLATLRISRAAADQRAGRAGREAPGVAIRLWSAALHRGLAPFDRPEILEAELPRLVLDCAAWGADPAELPFADPPPAGRAAAGRALLAELGALDADGRMTDGGRRMARLGAHPRLAAMMLAAERPARPALAADLAALLEERDPLRGAGAGGHRTAAGGAARPPGRRRPRRDGPHPAGRPAISRPAAARRRRGRGRCRRRCSPPRFPTASRNRAARPGSFRLSGGGGAELPAADPLARRQTAGGGGAGAESLGADHAGGAAGCRALPGVDRRAHAPSRWRAGSTRRPARCSAAAAAAMAR